LGNRKLNYCLKQSDMSVLSGIQNTDFLPFAHLVWLESER